MSMGSVREIDYYIKGLPFKVRQEIFERIADIGEVRVKYLLKKDENYPDYREMGLSTEQILRQIEKATQKFGKVNEVMMENERYPLFKDPNDTYKSSLQYVNILKKREEKELIEKFGCTWEEYVPKVYSKDELEASQGEK